MVQTIQKTAKIWKLAMLIGAGIIAWGVILGIVRAQDVHGSQETAWLVKPIMLGIGGIFVFLFARFMAWWHHG